jgi:hypothetical protein
VLHSLDRWNDRPRPGGDQRALESQLRPVNLDDVDRESLERDELSIKYLDYDWTLNEKAAEK